MRVLIVRSAKFRKKLSKNIFYDILLPRISNFKKLSHFFETFRISILLHFKTFAVHTKGHLSLSLSLMPFIFIFFSNAHITLTPFTLITNSFYLPLSLSVANTLRSVYLHETGTSCLTTHTQSLLKHILSLSLFLSLSLCLSFSISLKHTLFLYYNFLT